MSNDFDITSSSISNHSIFILTKRISVVRMESKKKKPEWIYGLFPIMIGLAATIDWLFLGLGLIGLGIIILCLQWFRTRSEFEVLVGGSGIDQVIFRSSNIDECISMRQKIIDAMLE